MVDVVLNIFAKPYQTALSVLSLLRFCEQHIDRIYLQFEPAGSLYDATPPYSIARYIRDRAIAWQPEIWIECDAVEPDRLPEKAYRLALRYQSAFENTDKRHLFVMHNDVIVTKDVIGAMLETIGDAFALGQIGQCWNCPASQAAFMNEAGLGDAPCTPQTYMLHKLTFAELETLYAVARAHGASVRPYCEGWHKEYQQTAWPLPECRVNEWACLVDIQRVRPHVYPEGPVLPFGAYEACGSVALDIDVAWFRDLHRRGLHAKHFPLDGYVHHWIGSFRMSRSLHMQAEHEARELLGKSFRDFVEWCKKENNGLF